MDEQNSPIFSQAKLEYTNQLIDTLTPHIFDGIKSIYDEARTVNSVNRRQSITLLFRDFLENVPSWSNVLIEAETERIIKMSNCDWLDDLITAVFISHTKILTSIGANSSNIDLVIPKITNFVHKCYINIAREMWKNPYLFTDYSIASEYQKNMRTVELIIKESTENTIRQLLPIKEILKHNLDRRESRNVNEKPFENDDIRKILHDEIKNLNLGNILSTSRASDLMVEENENIHDDGEEEEEEEEEGVEEEEEDEKDEKDDNEELEHDGGKVDLKEDEIDDDYVSVDEETIQHNCENLDINTINDEKKEEEVYDNADIIGKEEEENDDKAEKSMLEKFIENLTQTNENDTNVDASNIHREDDKVDGGDKEEEIKSERVENIEDNLPAEENIREEIKELEKEDSFNENVIKKTETELISVEKISDNETVDEFFNDVSKIMENRTGVSVNRQPEKYTLFDDVDNKE